MSQMDGYTILTRGKFSELTFDKSFSDSMKLLNGSNGYFTWNLDGLTIPLGGSYSGNLRISYISDQVEEEVYVKDYNFVRNIWVEYDDPVYGYDDDFISHSIVVTTNSDKTRLIGTLSKTDYSSQGEGAFYTSNLCSYYYQGFYDGMRNLATVKLSSSPNGSDCTINDHQIATSNSDESTTVNGILSIQPDSRGRAGIYIPGVLRADNVDASRMGTGYNLCLEHPNADINRHKNDVEEYAFQIHSNNVDTIDWMYYYDDLEDHKIATFTFEEDNKTFVGYDPMKEQTSDSHVASNVYLTIGDNCSYEPDAYYQERLPTFHITHLASTITTIGNNAFKNNHQLTITDQLLPAALQSIGSSAFENCEHLGILHAEQCTSLTTIGENAFKGAVGTLFLGDTIFDQFWDQGRITVKENQNYIDDITVVRVPSNTGGN